LCLKSKEDLQREKLYIIYVGVLARITKSELQIWEILSELYGISCAEYSKAQTHNWLRIVGSCKLDTIRCMY
jgi:hypothetical protein